MRLGTRVVAAARLGEVGMRLEVASLCRRMTAAGSGKWKRKKVDNWLEVKCRSLVAGGEVRELAGDRYVTIVEGIGKWELKWPFKI